LDPPWRDLGSASSARKASIQQLRSSYLRTPARPARVSCCRKVIPAQPRCQKSSDGAPLLSCTLDR
jgi:hypothetical protein